MAAQAASRPAGGGAGAPPKGGGRSRRTTVTSRPPPQLKGVHVGASLLLLGSFLCLALLLPVAGAFTTSTIISYTRAVSFNDFNTSSATLSFNVPASSYYLVEGIGGGGGGGAKSGWFAGGGGGGGGYAGGVVYFGAATQLTVTIGQGGAATAYGVTAADGGAGTDTVVKTSTGVELIRAYG